VNSGDEDQPYVRYFSCRCTLIAITPLLDSHNLSINIPLLQVAHVSKVYADKKDNARLKVHWYYFPDDVPNGRQVCVTSTVMEQPVPLLDSGSQFTSSFGRCWTQVST
jgi:hypothetical protein